MRARVHFTVAEVDPVGLQERTVVVLDVLRATSTLVAALAAGARAIYPVSNAEDAVRLASSLGREDTLLCGERRGLKIEGYHLGNSPSEFTPERVSGKRLIMNTTNGTRACLAVTAAERVYVASLLNLGAVARAAARAELLTVLCAGREDRFALEDAICAGLLLERTFELRGGGEAPELDDAARAALVLSRSFTPDAVFLAETAAGQSLAELGLGGDTQDCARLDVHDIVPRMSERMIRLEDAS
jgi:2-phosphosulfolactate phosphatase